MSFADKFYSVLLVYVLSSLSYIGEILCILSVIFIMISFLGIKGEVTRKTFIPGYIFAGIVIVVNGLCVIHDFLVLRPHWNEAYRENAVALSDKDDFIIFFTIHIVVLVIAFTALTFKNHRVIKCMITFILMMLFETYISCEMLYTATFFSDEPRNYILKYSGIDGYLGTGFSTLFILVYIVIMLAFFLVLFFGMIKKQRTMYIGWNNRVLFILWEVLMIFIMRVPAMDGLSDIEQIKLIKYEFGIIMFLLGIAVPFLVILLISRRFAIEKTLLQEDYISAELNYINRYKKNQSETRAFRHDIINNLSLISAMHKEEKYDEIEEYLSTLLDSIGAMSPRYITGDEVLNSIVGMKVSQMDEDNIDFSVEGVLDHGLGMKPVDVCSIFANALDNAIEACEKVKEAKDRWIKLTLDNTDKGFMVKLKNSMPSGGIISNKDKNLHGYGIHNMRAVISNYGGIGEVNTDDNVFTLSILLPDKSR